MKIQEIELFKSLKNYDYSRDMADIIKGYGWNILGWGYEGVVAEHPTKPLAVKLFLSTSKYKSFVDLVQRNPKNPHFPKFYKYVKNIKGTYWSFVVTEKLIPVQQQDLQTKFLPEMCYMYLYANENGATISDIIYDILSRVWNTQTLDDVEEDIIEKANEADPLWKEAIELVTDQAINRLGLKHIDLHDENLMIRNDGTLVIIDPFY